MMKWKSSKTKERVSYRGHAKVGNDTVVLMERLTEFWCKVLDELDAQPEADAWDFLVVEFTTQCGSIMAFPMRKKEEYLESARFSVGLEVDAWADMYEALPDPDENEAKFDKAYNRLHKLQMSAIKKALGHPTLKSRFKALKRRSSFAVFGVDEGETPIPDRMEFLWGNRPAKRDFSDAKELFEHIFKKAELHPDFSMLLKEKRLVAVHWFGHEFSNKYVELLEEVPNIQELCRNLKDFIITSTRIDASGIERIKGLLPQAKVTLVSDEDNENGRNPWDDLRW